MKNFFNKALEVMVKLSGTKTLLALKDGFVLTMPITLIGSLFLLVANLPITGYADFMASTFGPTWNAGLNQAVGSTFDILAIVSVLGIGYAFAKNEGVDGMSSAVTSLVAFLIVTASTTVAPNGEVIGGVIPKTWTGGQGVITAILVGLIASRVFCWFVKKKITIKMPEGVPAGVANAFSALIPAFIIFTGATIVYQVILTYGTTLPELIFQTLQIPLQNLSDSYFGGLIICLLMVVLFWAGIHGPNIVMGIVAPILTANSLANAELAEQGLNTIENGARIVTPQLIDIFVKFGGVGITLGLLIAILIAAKSKQLKSISKLSLVPGIFNINEPVIFGLPIVYNPLMLIPFILVPVIAYTLIYLSITFGVIAPFTAVQVPWTMPPVLSGFILSGVAGAVLQIIIIAMSTFVYLPFVVAMDKQLVKNETVEGAE